MYIYIEEKQQQSKLLRNGYLKGLGCTYTLLKALDTIVIAKYSIDYKHAS